MPCDGIESETETEAEQDVMWCDLGKRGEKIKIKDAGFETNQT